MEFPGDTLSALLRTLAGRQPDREALVCPEFEAGGSGGASAARGTDTTAGGAAAATRGAELVSCGGGLRFTFAQLDARVDDLARGLLAAGIGRGEHVALWAANVPDWVPLEFALARIGAVLVTVNTALKHDEVAYVLEQSRAVAVLHTTRTGSNEAARILDDLLAGGHRCTERLRVRAWLPATAADPPPNAAPGHASLTSGTAPRHAAPAPGAAPAHAAPAVPGRVLPPVALEALVARGRSLSDAELHARERSCAASDVVNIQYTSGTTGFPKGVMLSHRNILGSGRALGAGLRTTPEDRLAVIVPFFHCFGCVVCVLGAYTHGATLCCLPQFEPGAALALLEQERCTLVHGVPTMFSAMLAHPDLPRRRIRTLRAGVAAGAPCPVPLMHAIVEELGCAGMSVTYGLTEASPGVSGSTPESPFTMRCETIGRPLAGVEVRIVDPATLAELPDGERGELLVHGENVMVGYHDDPAATARAVTADGWLRTGDLCLRDADGHLRIVGRLKDIIIRGGENIAPAEIENVLREHPDIADAAVVGVPSAYFGEEIGAALILRPGARFDPESYVALLTGRIACFKIPAAWKHVTAFPLTGSGKVQKFKLREQFAAEARATAPPTEARGT